jgi:hypothetical protein
VKKGFIATAALIGLLVAMEFIAPGHWAYLTEYLGKTGSAIGKNFGFIAP